MSSVYPSTRCGHARLSRLSTLAQVTSPLVTTLEACHNICTRDNYSERAEIFNQSDTKYSAETESANFPDVTLVQVS